MSEPRAEGGAGLCRNLLRHNRVQVVGQAYDGVEAAQMALRLRPDVLVVEEATAGLSGAEVCSLVSRGAPQVSCVLVGDRVDLLVARAAMRAGARAVFTVEDDIATVVATLEQLAHLSRQAASPEWQRLADPTRMPLTFAGLAAKEGQGTTTLLSALALQLARYPETETVLLDWRPQLSDLPALLGLRPRYSLVDLAPHGEQIDPEALDACLTRHDSGLWVLPGMLDPGHVWLQPLPLGFAAQLLGILRRRFRFIVCDLPLSLGPAEMYLCRHATALLLTSGLADAGALRAAATLTDLLRAQAFPDERLRLVVTRYDRQNPFTPQDLAYLTRLPIAATVPEDASLPKSLSAGDPSPAQQRSPGVAAVRDLAAALLPGALGTRNETPTA
jgi:Flp pilus assembly CpaE family ATPase